MEIEAKFSVPNPAVYFQLQANNRLAGYSLSTVQVKDIRDTYLDTSSLSERTKTGVS